MQIRFKKEIQPGSSLTTDEIVQMLLENRGITDIASFMNPRSPLEISLKDFGFNEEIKILIESLRKIHAEQKMIIVYTDYDADGITGGAILWETLHLLGFMVMPYVPDRHTEGYGFSKLGIDRVIQEHNPVLIISVDHGITAVTEIKYAKSKNVPVIVTDHHLKPEILPTDALTIIHTSELSGAGVAYMVAKEIYSAFGTGNSLSLQNNTHLKNHFSTDYLILATIGIIADLVPVVGAARSIVTYGLRAFSQTKRTGLVHLMKEAGIEGKPISPYEIGFIIAPRINAIGRLHHAIDALRLLCTTNSEKAAELAGRIGETNRQRQDLVTISVEEAQQMVVREYGDNIPKLIILNSTTWNEGIIGLIASKITEKYFRPCIILTKSDGHYKASARSIPAFHMTNFLRSLETYLVSVGGHQAAAGFTIEETKLKEFSTEAQQRAAKMITQKDLIRVLEADLKIPLSMITVPLVRGIERLQPFGIGNPPPTFYSTVLLRNAKLIGKENQHLQLVVSEDMPSAPLLECIAFSKGKLFTSLSSNQQLNIIYTPMIDRWDGKEKLKAKIAEIV